MLVIDYVGFVAGLLVTCSLVPQIIRVFQLKSAREISILFTTLLLIGLTLWLIYGIKLELIPVIIWNAIGMAFTSTLLYAKVKYGR